MIIKGECHPRDPIGRLPKVTEPLAWIWRGGGEATGNQNLGCLSGDGMHSTSEGSTRRPAGICREEGPVQPIV